MEKKIIIGWREFKMRENKCKECIFMALSGGRFPCNKCSKIMGNKETDKFQQEVE